MASLKIDQNNLKLLFWQQTALSALSNHANWARLRRFSFWVMFPFGKTPQGFDSLAAIQAHARQVKVDFDDCLVFRRPEQDSVSMS